MKSKIIFSTILVLALSLSLSFCTKEEEDARCNLEPDSGPCYAYFKKYYFDDETGKCTEFIYGGCDGTVPFETMEECESCNCRK